MRRWFARQKKPSPLFFSSALNIPQLIPLSHSSSSLPTHVSFAPSLRLFPCLIPISANPLVRRLCSRNRTSWASTSQTTMGLSKTNRIIILLVIDTAFFLLELIAGSYFSSSTALSCTDAVAIRLLCPFPCPRRRFLSHGTPAEMLPFVSYLTFSSLTMLFPYSLDYGPSKSPTAKPPRRCTLMG